MSASLCVYFRNTVVFDFEYEIEDGWLPNVLCLVAYLLDHNLQLISIIRRWRGEFGDAPPFDIGVGAASAYVLAMIIGLIAIAYVGLIYRRAQ